MATVTKSVRQERLKNGGEHGMFSKIWTKKSTMSYSEKNEKLREVLRKADAVVIGAGAGLSTAAGFTYSGDRFERYFLDFKAKYGIRDIYSGGFYPYETLEEYWAWWSRHIFYNRYVNASKPVYENLKTKDFMHSSIKTMDRFCDKRNLSILLPMRFPE